MKSGLLQRPAFAKAPWGQGPSTMALEDTVPPVLEHFIGPGNANSHEKLRL